MASEIVVRLSGEIDMATVEQAKLAVLAAVTENPGATVVVDLADVEFMDSTGLNALVAGHKAAAAQHGALTVRNARPPIERILKITGLDKVLTAFSDAEGTKTPLR